MAKYDNLPVFKAAYDLLLDIYRLSTHWKRDCRYTLGEELTTKMTEVLTEIYKANQSGEKKELLDKALQDLVVAKLYIRLLHDLEQLSLKQYALLAEKAELVSKQLVAWNKASKC